MTANRIAAAAVIAVAALLFALTFGFEELPAGLAGGFGAEAFPRLVLGTIMVLALLLALLPRAAEPQPPIPRMVGFSGAALLLFMALVPLVGMLPAMFLSSSAWDTCGVSAGSGPCLPAQSRSQPRSGSYS